MVVVAGAAVAGTGWLRAADGCGHVLEVFQCATGAAALIGRCNKAIVYVVPIVKCCLPWPRRGHGRCNMDGGIQHQGGWLSEHETTHNFFHPQKGKGDGPPTHRGGAGLNFCVLASSRPFREGGEGGAARETYM